MPELEQEIECLVAEIGSTTTVVNAFCGLTGDGSRARFLGQGLSRTTVREGDVSLGLALAISDLEEKLQIPPIRDIEVFATSSAAGGLKMSCHGLVYEMTVRAAREACLGSGAIVRLVTAGRLRQTDLTKVEMLKPGILFLAGGTDYGERDTALYNAEKLMSAFPGIPLIYAGNIENQEEIRLISERFGSKLYLSENVYPEVDCFRIEEARTLIHQVFEEHIIESAGLEHIRDRVTGPIIPTPGAVMEAAILLQKHMGDLIVFDVGGATTDLHSVSEVSGEIAKVLVQAEPFAKRTVEGDLGVFVNRMQIWECFNPEERRRLGPDFEARVNALPEIPTCAEEIDTARILTQKALNVALSRHAGQFFSTYTASGSKRLAKGKDLSAVQWVIGTGGALTRLPQGDGLLRHCLNTADPLSLSPPRESEIILDRDYIMASAGVIAKRYPEAALTLLRRSFGMS